MRKSLFLKSLALALAACSAEGSTGPAAPGASDADIVAPPDGSRTDAASESALLVGKWERIDDGALESLFVFEESGAVTFDEIEGEHAEGTYSIDGPLLTIDFVNDEGAHFRTEVDFYVDGHRLMLSAMLPQTPITGEAIGTWSGSFSRQKIDASGQVSSDSSGTRTVTFKADSTMMLVEAWGPGEPESYSGHWTISQPGRIEMNLMQEAGSVSMSADFIPEQAVGMLYTRR